MLSSAHEKSLVEAKEALEVGDYLKADSIARVIVLEQLTNSEAILVRAHASEALGNFRAALFSQGGADEH